MQHRRDSTPKLSLPSHCLCAACVLVASIVESHTPREGIADDAISLSLSLLKFSLCPSLSLCLDTQSINLFTSPSVRQDTSRRGGTNAEMRGGRRDIRSERVRERERDEAIFILTVPQFVCERCSFNLSTVEGYMQEWQ